MGTMELKHLVARLNALALWHTPGAPARLRHYPAGEATWLREAATKLQQMDGDLNVVESTHVAKGPHWAHWAVLNAAGDIVLAASTGPGPMHEHVSDMIRFGNADARNWVVRPLIIGRPA